MEITARQRNEAKEYAIWFRRQASLFLIQTGRAISVADLIENDNLLREMQAWLADQENARVRCDR